MTIELFGNWTKGFSVDVHTLSSTYLGIDSHGYEHWDNVRSEMGNLIYSLKYKSDISVLPRIMTLLEKIKGIEKIDAIVPIPSSKQRIVDPVKTIAVELGRKHSIPVLLNVITKQHNSSELKNIVSSEDRLIELQKSMMISSHQNLFNKNILLVDDLYRSGATLTEATRLLKENAKVANVFVITMTKTRSNR